MFKYTTQSCLISSQTSRQDDRQNGLVLEPASNVCCMVITLFPGPVRCRAQSANTEAESRPVLPANTRVFLRLTKTLAKHDTRPGEPVEFVVDSNVVVNGRVLINGGMMVSGSFRGLNQSGKDLSRVLFDLGPLQTTT